MTITHSEAMHVAKRVFGRFVVFDVTGALALVHPDSTWTFPGDPTILPWAGSYAGSELKRRFFDTCRDTLEYLEYTVHAYHPVGEDKVLVLSRERCRVKATQRCFTHELCALLTVREGKVSAFLEYADTAAMQAAF